MCGSNPNEACGFPSGTIRAILAIMIIPPVIIGSVVLMILMFYQNQYTSALGILSGLTGIAGSVVGYYFGTKSAEKSTSEIIKSHNDTKDAIIASHTAILENKNREIQTLSNRLV